jgi:hypothetical protein
MPRRYVTLLIIAQGLCWAAPESAIWPGELGDLKIVSTEKIKPHDAAVWDEYGLDAAEQAQYTGAGKNLTATAYRLKDPTGALGAYEWLMPAAAKRSKLSNISVEKPDGGALLLLGNYVIDFQQTKPTDLQIRQLFYKLPRVDQSSLPPLRDYVPQAGLVLNSERYVLGPASLQLLEPRISPSIAAFHLGAEAQYARFRTPHGEMPMLIFNYPTPQMARERLDAFQKIPGAVARRTGPLLAITVSPSNPDDAERLLAEVKYEPTVTWNEKMRKPEGNAGDMLMAICMLALVLIVASVLVGFALGGMRILREKFGMKSAEASFTSLDLSKK